METRMTGTFNRVQLDPGIRYALASAYIFLANIVRMCVRVYKYIYMYVYPYSCQQCSKVISGRPRNNAYRVFAY